MSIVTRLGKGAPLTFAEMDGNFTTIAGLINAGFNYAIDTGSLNAIQITLATPPALYIDGMNFSTKVANTTTSTSTLQVNALGVKNIYDEYGVLLPAGLLAAGQIYTFVYNSSLNSGAGGFNTYLANTSTQPYPATTNNPGTTVGGQLTNLGSATGANNVGYTPTGGVATTVSAKLKQIVSVVDFGADPTGVADSTAAITAATASFRLVIFPAGSYKITSLSFTNITNCMWLGAANSVVGITTTTPGTMITWGNGCNFNVIDGFVFQPTGTLANSVGMLMNGNCGNTEIRRCIFQNWTKIGMWHFGTVGTQMSGHKVYDCYFLQNSNSSGFGQLEMTYNNDFFIANNQFGIIGLNGGPSFGIQATNTSNGGYYNNFVWQNNVGANFVTCKYDRIWSNRFEQSQKEGCILTSCIETLFNNNWLNNNGQLTLNTYNHLRWITCSESSCTGNVFFDWSGGTNSQKYAISVESSSSTMTFKGNIASAYATGAWQFDSTISNQSINTDGAFTFNSGGSIAAATTTFLGMNSVNATAANVSQYLPAKHTIVRMMCAVTAAPGAGQSFAYTLYKNGVATSTTITLSGAAAFQGFASAATVLEDVSNNSFYTVQVVTSAGAASATHFATVQWCER